MYQLAFRPEPRFTDHMCNSSWTRKRPEFKSPSDMPRCYKLPEAYSLPKDLSAWECESSFVIPCLVRVNTCSGQRPQKGSSNEAFSARCQVRHHSKLRKSTRQDRTGEKLQALQQPNRINPQSVCHGLCRPLHSHRAQPTVYFERSQTDRLANAAELCVESGPSCEMDDLILSRRTVLLARL